MSQEIQPMRTLILAVLLALPVALSGCNTVEGVGEDIESAGDALDDEAEEHGG